MTARCSLTPELITSWDQLQPEPDRLQVVIFGPGHGEACVVRLPNGAVGVVDGCAEPSHPDGKGDPVRELLQHWKVERLAFVCLTHPHADHFKGMAALLKAYTPEKVDRLFIPHILSQKPIKKFLRWLELRNDPAEPEQLKGLESLCEQLELTSKSVDADCMSVNMQLLDCDEFDADIWAVGPSGNDVTEALKLLVADLEGIKAKGRSELRHDPNAISGALLVRYGKAQVLLAGDLINVEGEHSGWNRAQKFKGFNQPVQVVNVAHHASREAHHDALWNKMACQLAIVTPFQRAGGAHPPRPEQLGLLAQSARVLVTASLRWKPEELATFQRQPERVPTKANPVQVAGNTKLPVRAPSSKSARSNLLPGGVCVSLDATGQICRVGLLGEAQEYQLH